MDIQEPEHNDIDSDYKKSTTNRKTTTYLFVGILLIIFMVIGIVKGNEIGEFLQILMRMVLHFILTIQRLLE